MQSSQLPPLIKERHNVLSPHRNPSEASDIRNPGETKLHQHANLLMFILALDVERLIHEITGRHRQRLFEASTKTGE